MSRERQRIRRTAALVAAVATVSFWPWVRVVVPAIAQTGAQSPPSRPVPTFEAATELVYVRFHVEAKGRYSGTIRRDQVRVLEDGKPQEVVLLETPSTRERTIPPELTLVLDVSSSVMDAQLLDERLVRDVLFASLGEQARVGLCAFGGALRCFTPPTRDAEAVLAGFRDAIHFAAETRFTGTRLYGSLVDLARGEAPHGETGEDRAPAETGQAEPDGRAADDGRAAASGDPAQAAPARTQRALVVFSDGLDTTRGRWQDAADAARQGNMRVHTVLLSQAFQDTARGPLLGRAPNRAMYDYKKFDLANVAGRTGGRSYEPGSLDSGELARILREVATEVTMENVVGYAPAPSASPRKRTVKVELVDRSAGRIRGGERTFVR